MRISDLLRVLDEMAPFSLAEPWDNCGLLVGDDSSRAERLLVALELTEDVVGEALEGGFDTILTHHPVLFSPVSRLTESDPRQRLLRKVISARINVVSCHTNLDSASGGIADLVADGLGLENTAPLQMTAAGWYKFVGFVPEAALPEVADAVFAEGAGVIGEYRECAYSLEGTGWFTPGVAANPTVGTRGTPERVAEVRWETVVPRGRIEAVIGAFKNTHPYEEPAFDIYPVEDRLPRAGLGRVGDLPMPEPVQALAARASRAFGIRAPLIGGALRDVTRVAVLPGSGRSLLRQAAGVADVLITGDLAYHDSEMARDLGLGLIALPHGELEWWAMARWSEGLGGRLESVGVEVSRSEAWRSPWTVEETDSASEPRLSVATALGSVAIWIDGGSRGNPGPSAIGIVVMNEAGEIIEEIGRRIGIGTNNAAEYEALLAALDLAAGRGFTEIEIVSDSELLVQQMRGEYRVKNEMLKELHAEARRRADEFARVEIRHVPREENARADALVNRALDETRVDTSTLSRGNGPADPSSPGLF